MLLCDWMWAAAVALDYSRPSKLLTTPCTSHLPTASVLPCRASVLPASTPRTRLNTLNPFCCSFYFMFFRGGCIWLLPQQPQAQHPPSIITIITTSATSGSTSSFYHLSPHHWYTSLDQYQSLSPSFLFLKQGKSLDKFSKFCLLFPQLSILMNFQL